MCDLDRFSKIQSQLVTQVLSGLTPYVCIECVCVCVLSVCVYVCLCLCPCLCVCVCLRACVLCEVLLLIKLTIVLIKLVMQVLSGLTPYVCIECVCIECVLSVCVCVRHGVKYFGTCT